MVDLGATLFWFALLINAFNLIDGMDGACGGLGMIASAGLVGMLLFLGQPTDAMVLVALAYVALLWASDLKGGELVLALLLHSLIASLGIMGARASLRVARGLSAWLHSSVSSDNDVKTLTLRAGENAILYLCQVSFEDQKKAMCKVVGLIDDNPFLYQKTVYGFPVLGNFSELELDCRNLCSRINACTSRPEAKEKADTECRPEPVLD